MRAFSGNSYLSVKSRLFYYARYLPVHTEVDDGLLVIFTPLCASCVCHRHALESV